MPEVVSTYLSTEDLKKVRSVQKKLLGAYENDFSKHAPVEIVTRIKMLWNSIPTQLAKKIKNLYMDLFEKVQEPGSMKWLLHG